MVDSEEPVVLLRFFRQFAGPGHMVRHVDSEASGLEDGDDVRFDRVTHHQKLFRGDPVAAVDIAVRFRIFFGNDLDVREVVGQSGLTDLPLLVAEIAFGDDQEPVVFRK